MAMLVLDPGHGGRDPGAVGNKLQEKDVNLRVCLLLRDALVRSGVRVLMTRETDTMRVPDVAVGVDLKARAMLANTYAADLFVSWHYDAATDLAVNGVAVWIHPSQREQPCYHKAELLAQSIATNACQKNRGVYFGDFQVLRDTMMDAVLVEGGFITSPEEATRLSNADFLRHQAEGAAKALCQILDVPYIPAVETDVAMVPVESEEVVQVTFNGQALPQRGLLIDGKTYVPVRELAEVLGCAVQWDGSTQTVELTKVG
ncbi:N-acetylmuramoyl-L-alanine amidase [Tumebacillus permanentifrigoris]|uniref:N-acetylmuramoyl-L-alanine amidase n=1 Tax=Tumebacillus permanentifrigoris TaxID=378543 RepID=A0A316D9F6_9BACL|nr:N-acetylmuramoyl-L-alanine amidase [Tumebacillus permanentifrigoris]PWK13808.1 N-acetylmuramoyl-L-alanine amidase [Tumebacillus permanentifrigoris]